MIRIRQVKVSILKDNHYELVRQIAKKIKINTNNIDIFRIVKKSLDARFKPNLFYIYEVDIKVNDENNDENAILKKNKMNSDIIITPKEEYEMPTKGDSLLNYRPVIVGSGPAGLFCAYLLAEMGYKPIIVERGEMIDDRIVTVEKFWLDGILNLNSNVQFGEGGAGTFSDGKLNTLTKDKLNRCKKVFETFVLHGANDEIMYSNTPHIGTDVLRIVVRNIRNKIIAMGGEFFYNSCVTDIKIVDDKIKGIIINNTNIINTEILVLAIGHSARDTFEMLFNHGLIMESKPFALGIRIQHPQEVININQYGNNYEKTLAPANYKLTYKSSNGRGVYSFCMCPGGYVVNASSENGKLAINGMSYFKRDSVNANSAIVVTVDCNDFGSHPLDGMRYQKELEERAYNLGEGQIPVQLLKDYYLNQNTVNFGDVLPIFKGNYNFVNLNELYPQYINESLKEAIIDFGKKIKGFDDDSSIIAGIESRTSSPVRIIRNEEFVSNIDGIYPCGEGAGYAGGITTSAIDGLKVAEAIINKYKM